MLTLLATAVAARATLQIVSAQCPNPLLKAGDSQVVLFGVHNHSAASLSGVPYRIQVDAVTLISERVDLRPNWTENLSANWRPTAGAHEYTLEIDPGNTLGLHARRSLKVPRVAAAAAEKPDRSLENPLGGSLKPRVALRNLRVERGAPVLVVADVQFLGVTRRDGITYRVSLEGSGYPLIHTRNLPLAPSGVQVREAFEGVDPGRYQVTVELDPDNHLGETREERANNRASSSVEQ